MCHLKIHTDFYEVTIKNIPTLTNERHTYEDAYN